jgi:hypothetical protein
MQPVEIGLLSLPPELLIKIMVMMRPPGTMNYSRQLSIFAAGREQSSVFSKVASTHSTLLRIARDEMYKRISIDGRKDHAQLLVRTLEKSEECAEHMGRARFVFIRRRSLGVELSRIINRFGPNISSLHYFNAEDVSLFEIGESSQVRICR